jgi:hypothetical protein
LGTLNRLDLALTRFGLPEPVRTELLQPWRRVRRLRQKPTHALTENVTSTTFVHHQASLLLAATNSLNLLRRFWQTHPANSDWDEPDFATAESKSYWL